MLAPSDASIDHNCNGIKGANASGSFESQLCSGAYTQRGLILLGDSATAHFHIPPQVGY
jgi:acyloxyacyl hydrolase